MRQGSRLMDSSRNFTEFFIRALSLVLLVRVDVLEQEHQDQQHHEAESTHNYPN